MAPVLSATERRTLWAMARRVLNGAKPDRLSVLDECERLLAGEAAGVRWLVRLFLGLVRHLPRLTAGREFSALDAERQDAFLARLEMSGLKPLRSGFWGVRTIILVSHYGRPEAGAALGWKPVDDGNAELRRRRA